MVKQDSVTVTGQRLDGHTVSLEDVMNRVVHEIGYRKKYEQCSFGESDSDELYGIGLAISYRGASLGAEGMDFCSCILNGQNDGSILLETGIHENGQGSESAMSLILADEPTANLDSKTGKDILELMLELNRKEGTTFIFSTHDPMVMECARRLVKLRDGVVESESRR